MSNKSVTSEREARNTGKRSIAALRGTLTGAAAPVVVLLVLWSAHRRSLPQAPPSYLTGPVSVALHQRDLSALARELDSLKGIDQRDEDGLTALFVAVRGGYADVVELLLARGADPNYCHPGFGTPLIAALNFRDVATTRLLLRYGADPGQVTPLGDTAFFAAVRGGDLEGVRLLVALRVEPMPPGARENPLNVATTSAEDADLLRFLLTLGVDPNRAGRDGALPAVSAAAAGSAECLRLLMSAGADPDLCDARGRSARNVARDNAALRFVFPASSAARASPPP